MITDYGLTALASAITGGYVPPLYLVIDTKVAILQANMAIGDTTFQTDIQIDQSGDTELVLSVGLANQEVVQITGAPTGTGPYTYTLITGVLNVHTMSDPVVRNPTVNDTMANILGEVEFDSTNSPGQRIQAPAGYSGGPGNWVSQFYMTGNQANVFIASIGLADDPNTGQGNLHALFPYGADHTDITHDIEVDASLTLTNV